MHGPMNIKYEFSSLVPHVTPWEGMSRHVPVCPQSARPPPSYSFWHTHCKQTVISVPRVAFVMSENVKRI